MTLKDSAFTAGGFPGDFVTEKPRAKTSTLAEILPGFFNKLERGEPPIVWPVDERPWGKFAFRPGHIVCVGGPTNSGKTAFAVNTMFRAMAITPSLKVVLASVEEDAEDLVCRGIAGLMDIPVSVLRNRDRSNLPDGTLARIKQALDGISSRLLIVRRPFTLDQVALAAKDFRAQLVVADYLQELRVDGYDGDLQETLRRSMPMLRTLADSGPCVFVMSALSREGVFRVEHSGGRRTIKAADKTAFLGGTQIEYGVNDAYLLLEDGGSKVASVHGAGGEHPFKRVGVWLQHVKARGDRTTLVPLWFDGTHQKFTLRELPGQSSVQAPGSTIGESKPTASAKKPSSPKVTPLVAKVSVQPNKEDDDGPWLDQQP